MKNEEKKHGSAAGHFLAEFHSGLTVERARTMAGQAVGSIWSQVEAGQPIPRQAMAILCELTAHGDPEVAQAGVTALFPGLIERLNDSFAPEAPGLYVQVFGRVIDYYRRRPEAALLDETLNRFGLRTISDLAARHERIKSRRAVPADEWREARKVLFLSRVTIGADVAVTSVLMDGLRKVMPRAEFVLLGSRKLGELYGGDPRIRVREIAYQRGGSVLSRLTSWRDVIAAVNEERIGLAPGELWVVDPDSRLTQLGLLPLLDDERSYFFFPSREYGEAPEASLGQLASAWVSELTGEPGPSWSFLALPEKYRRMGEEIAGKARSSGATRIATVSLGVGGNEEKRLSTEFERDLIRHLTDRYCVILDKGAGPEERRLIDELTAGLKSEGKTIVEATEENWSRILAGDAIQAHVLTWEGGIGSLAGLIAASDRYVGYDSSGQHLAAAMQVPSLTVFVTNNPPVFAERWRPYGQGDNRVFRVDDKGMGGNEVMGRMGRMGPMGPMGPMGEV